MNIHIIVIVLTIIVYIYLKTTKNDNNKTKKNNFIYILLTPIILYTGNYFYTNYNIQKDIDVSSSSSTRSLSNTIDNSDDLLSIPYPQSTISE